MKCKKNGKKVFGFLGLGALIAGAFAMCCLGGCNRWKSPEKRAEWMVDKVSSKLDLNDEQVVKLQAVKDAFLEARKRHHSDKENMHADIERMILAKELTEVEVKALIEKKRKAHDSEIPNLFPKIKEFHSSLTVKQKQKAVELLKKFKEKMGHHS